MELPFSEADFFRVMAEYNEAVWPAQWLLYAVGVGLAVAPLARRQLDARLFYWPMAGLWAWMALAYHWAFFRAINPAATLFAALFLAQAMLLLWASWRVPDVVIRRSGWLCTAGLALLAYALIIYPGLNLYLGDRYPEMVTFGLPCPTTIFTVGLLALPERGGMRLLAVIPLLWGLVGGSAAWLLGVEQDYGLVVAAFVAMAIVSRRDRRLPGGDH